MNDILPKSNDQTRLDNVSDGAEHLQHLNFRFFLRRLRCSKLYFCIILISISGIQLFILLQNSPLTLVPDRTHGIRILLLKPLAENDSAKGFLNLQISHQFGNIEFFIPLYLSELLSRQRVSMSKVQVTGFARELYIPFHFFIFLFFKK